MTSKALISLLLLGSAMYAPLPFHLLRAEAPAGSSSVLNVKTYGAVCDWNGTGGTDDTKAFQAAIDAAHGLYAKTGFPITVLASNSCEITGTVNLLSGVTLSGPAKIIIPSQTAKTPRTTFLIEAADRVSIENLEIDVLSNKCGNDAACSAIRYEGTSSDKAEHSGVYIRKNIIVDSAWGIFVRYVAGSGSLRDIDISSNTIKSTFPYTGSDGIHIAGKVSGFTISANKIVNRGDAAIAATSEAPEYRCSRGVVRDNLLIEDLVGLDNGGCSDITYTGNHVKATTTTQISNPAFRSYPYHDVKPTHVTIEGNRFENPPGSPDVAAKIDMAVVSKFIPDNTTESIFTANIISSLYLRGSSIEVRDNTFLPSATLTLDYYGQAKIASTNNIIGPNTWQGQGSITAGANPGLLSNNLLAPQFANGPITITNGGNFVHP